MFRKLNPSRVLFIIATSVLLLTAAVLVQDGLAGAREPGSSFVGSSTQSRTLTFSYDDAGRLVGVEYGGGKGITYTYDAAGNLLRREVYGVATLTPTPTATSTPTRAPTPTPTVTPTPVMRKTWLPLIH